MRAAQGQVAVRHELDGLLTPSRDIWDAIVQDEIRTVLREPVPEREKVLALVEIVERERQRGCVGEER
jgi:hypothetical protein